MEREFRPVSALFAAQSRRSFLAKTIAGAATVAGVASLGMPEFAFAASGLPVLGHDISTLQQEESIGKTFSDGGTVVPLEKILANRGTTYIRERLWVNPPIAFNNLSHVLAMATRIKAAGLKLLLDFHYSDFWADPGTQTTPSAWQGQSLSTLSTTLYNYTYSVISSLVAQGTPPAMVQTGNEVTDGMLWPTGQIYVGSTQNWTSFATLMKSAISAVRAASPSTRVMIHIDRGGDNGGAEYFYDHILAQGVSFDVIGLSYYPWWHGPLANLQTNLNALSPRYGKDIVVVETAYPWTLANGDSTTNDVTTSSQLLSGYPASAAGQLAYIKEVISIIKATPNGHGLGVVYWEPAWIPGVGWESGQGDQWDNMTLFNYSGQSLSSIACYQ